MANLGRFEHSNFRCNERNRRFPNSKLDQIYEASNETLMEQVKPVVIEKIGFELGKVSKLLPVFASSGLTGYLGNEQVWLSRSYGKQK